MIAALALCTPYTAQAQSSGNVENRIQRLENEIQTLSRAIFRGETPPPGAFSGGGADQAALANTEVRLSQIELDMRTLTGRLEEISFEINRLKDNQEQTIAALETRIAELERGQRSGFPAQSSAAPLSNAAGTTRSASPSPPPFTAAAPPSGQLGTLRESPAGTLSAPPAGTGDPAAAYEAAFNLIRSRDYDAAESAFTAFLAQHPGHDLASNASYWLGETHYVRGDFEAAARIFAEGYQRYPQGAKAPDNLLKMGMSLSGMGSPQDACVAYAQLQKEYPAGAGPILDRAAQEMERLNCGAR
jgi:tol-pal system protein YbgF